MEKVTHIMETKVLSVRVPLAEARQIDESARRCGLNRNDYMRMKLMGEAALADIGQLDELISAIRQIEQVLERYLDVLEELAPLCHGAEGAATLSHIEEEIRRAEALIDLCFKIQKQAAKLLGRIRKKVAR